MDFKLGSLFNFLDMVLDIARNARYARNARKKFSSKVYISIGWPGVRKWSDPQIFKYSLIDSTHRIQAFPTDFIF